jgi:ribosome-binding protein aMBF1 (putative translation factor)
MRANHNLGKIEFQREINKSTGMIVGSTPSDRIKWARIQKGWLIKTLATKAGITPEGLSIMERSWYLRDESIT